MKSKNLYHFRLVAVLLSLIFFSTVTNAQKFLPQALRDAHAPISQPPQAILQNCNIPNLSNCNYVSNYTFTPSAAYNSNIYEHLVDPFNYNGVNTLIPNWEVATGTPTVWANQGFGGYPLPPSGSNYYYGHVGWYGTAFSSESIVQKIPTLSTTKTYTLSFQKMYKSWLELPPPYNTDFPVASFKIILMKCQDYAPTFLPLSYMPRIPPANSQTIYCETNVHNANWQEVFFKFTPNDNYNLMWIFPETENTFPVKVSGLLATKPELIDVTNFTAGPAPTPTTGNCVVTIGPTTPNCVPTTAVLKWYGPNGQIITAPATQKIQVDASIPANQGTWTLKLEMPNAVTTNSQCGIQNPVIQSTVNVPFCASTTPIINGYYGWSGGGCPGPNTQILPNFINYYCDVIGECPIKITIESNYISNNVWFINDIQIPTTGGAINGIGNVYVYNNTKQLVIAPYFLISTNQLLKIKAKNCNGSNQCTQFSSELLVFPLTVPGTTGSIPPAEIGGFKPGQTKTYYNRPFNSAGPNASYYWNVPNAIVTDIDNSTPEAVVYFPPSFPPQNAIGTITITNSPSCNGVYNILFHYDPYSFTNNENGILKIYPNPTTTQVTISTTNNALIQLVEIGNLFNPIIKRVFVGNNKSSIVNVSELSPGIYNCKITTNKGVEYQKLIIKR